MKVIHMIPQLRLGAGRYVAEAAAFQSRILGHEVEVVVSPDAEGNWKTDPRLVEELVSFHVPVRLGGDFFHRALDGILHSAAQMSAYFSSSAGEILVHAHSAIAAVAARWAGASCVVATCHGLGPGRPTEYDLQDAIAFALCDAVVTPSEYWGERLRSCFGVADPVVIPVGIDVSRYPLLSRGADRYRRPPRVVTISELIHRKGVDLMIAAMPDIWQYSREIELHIFGEGDDEKSLRDQARVLDPDGSRIRFRGYVPQPYARLADFDLFLLASRSDNQPLALMEAMLAGLPIVASAAGGIPEMVLPSGCGIVVEAEAPARLAEAVVSLLREGPGHLDTLGAGGRNFARHHYAIEKTMRDLDDLYQAALHPAARRSSAEPFTPGAHAI